MLQMLFVSFLLKIADISIGGNSGGESSSGSSNGNQEPQRACAVCALVGACVCASRVTGCVAEQSTRLTRLTVLVAIRLVLAG